MVKPHTQSTMQPQHSRTPIMMATREMVLKAAGRRARVQAGLAIHC